MSTTWLLPVLARREPFACDLWRDEVSAWLSHDVQIASMRQQRFFGGLYQVVTLVVGESPPVPA